MLDAALTAQLRSYLEKVRQPVDLVASVDDGPKSGQLLELLDEIAALSERITVRRDGDDPRRPSFAIRRAGTGIEVRFAAIPLGHEFTSLVLALLQVGGHPSTAAEELLDRARQLPGEHHFETFLSLSCQNCPDVVQALNLLAVLNPGITHTSIDGALFPEEAERRRVLAVPTVFRDGEPFGQGRMTLDEILTRLDAGAEEREDTRLTALDPFDVLVVGGGPAGAAAAVYAARKGIRTGLVAERFGGQVLDTMAIENLVGTPHTEGPRLAADLERHVGSYQVEKVLGRNAVAVHPAGDGQPHARVDLDGGVSLSARTVVLATGARWRTIGVPGEQEYRNAGVTFCPHCDGPLFAGKRVAVIGGGNSGIEAAIDLAGTVAHVTVLEFDHALRADAVLQRKLHSLGNVDVLLGARTTEVLGDGTRVTGLTYQDRTSGQSRELALDGVFVQIGLLPNTEWLSGTVELSPRGEVVVDAAGRTSTPGVFAAGDCTTSAYKQIVIAVGSGATAALSAFDHLIRVTAPAGNGVTGDGATGSGGTVPVTEPAPA
jgi:NADH-dependent peroxiredoxin subunit F